MSCASLAARSSGKASERESSVPAGVTVAENFAEVLPDAEVAVLAGAGHFPWVDEPDRFRSAVETFLA